MIGTILLVAITIVLLVLIYLIRFPLPNTPPQVYYTGVTDSKYPAWGDPTDCFANLANNWSYYVTGGTDSALWNTYVKAWDTQCDNGDASKDNGTYDRMNATRIIIEGTSQTIPLSAVEFNFICTNTTPKLETTELVSGYLDDMEWVPGGSQNLSADAPKLGTCGGFNPEGSGANSVYYNRLGFFDPLSTSTTVLSAGQSLVIYIDTPDSIFEAPNPIDIQGRAGTNNACPATGNNSTCPWGQPDTDDYHGAPLWCFTVPGACTLQFVDTAWTPSIVLLTIPVYDL